MTITDSRGCEEVVTFEIFAELTIIEEHSDELCLDDCNGTIDLTISGGLPDYAVYWDSGVSGNSLEDLCAGQYSYSVQDSWGTVLSGSVTIEQGPELSLSAEYEDIICPQSEGAFIELTVEQGTLPYFYLWNTGDVNHKLFIDTAGNYSVTVTDINNCSLVDTFFIDQSPPISIEAQIENNGCSPEPLGSIDLTVQQGDGPFSFLWESGQNTEDREMLTQGSYFVTITDIHDCTLVDSFEVFDQGDIEVQETVSHPSCFNSNDGSIFIEIEGGEAPYQIMWNTGQDTTALSDLAAGTYEVTIVDDTGCQNSETFEITAPSDIEILNTLNHLSCFEGSDGFISIELSGGTAPYQIMWNTGQDTTALSNLAAGTYEVTVYDDSDCQKSTSFEIIAPPEIEIFSEITNSSCGGTDNGSIALDLSGGAEPLLINWNTGSVGDTITNLGSGLYIVTITDTNSCIKIDSFEVFEQGEVEIEQTLAHPSCFEYNNGSITLELSGESQAFDIAWNTGSDELILNALDAGIYTVTITDAYGCEQIENFEIIDPDVLTVNVTVNEILCFGDSGNISLSTDGGTGMHSFLWNTDENAEQINVLADIDYTVTITDENGCSVVEEFILTQPPMLEIFIIDVVNPGSGNDDGSISIDVSGGIEPYGIEWNDENAQSTETVSNLGVGSYWVIVTDAMGCVQTMEFTLTFANLSIQLVEDQNLCFEDCEAMISLDISGGIEPYYILWSNGENTPIISALCNGHYYATITDELGNMIETGPIEINSPDEIVLNSSITHISCPDVADGSISVEWSGGTQPFDIIWSNGHISNEIEDLVPGSYIVTVTDNNQCEAFGEYTIPQPATFDLEVLVQPKDCDKVGTDILIQGTFPDSISILMNGLFANLDVNNEISGLTGGQYIFSYQLNENCELRFDSIQIDEDLVYEISLNHDLLETFQGNVIVIEFNLLSDTPMYNYLIDWQSSNPFDCIHLDDQGQCDQIALTVNNEELLYLLFIDEFGCETSDSILIRIESDVGIYAPNVFSPNGDGINDEFMVFSNLENAQLDFLRIYDRWGNLVHEQHQKPFEDLKSWNGTFLGSELMSGVYVFNLSVNTDQGQNLTVIGDLTLLR